MKISNGMDSPVEKIKERLSIEEVVSSYIKLERSGMNFKARCPFHNEKTPSFYVSPDRGGYYCFGCSAKGDIFTFVEEFEGLDFKGALKLLAERAGVQLARYNPKEESEKEKLYRVMEEATAFFEKNLETNAEAKKYLKDRGLEEKTTAEFRIGFVPDDWRLLYAHLQKKGFADSEIEKAGLAKKSEKSLPASGWGMYDRFRSRIMFPISDSSGRVIAFSGRVFGPASENPANAKYLNSPDTPIFYKSSVLYGLDKAKDSIRKNNFSILVEGQMDLVLSHQAGFKNTVATSGTALSESTVSRENAVNNLGLIRRLSGNIVLAFDADKAGLSAAGRAGKIALALGMDVKAASLPEGIDPADLIVKEGAEAWKAAVRNSKHIIEFLLEKVLKNTPDERKAGREIKEKILPYVASLDSAIEQAHFLKKISDASGIPESALQEDWKKVEQEVKYTKEAPAETSDKYRESKMFRRDYIERRLLGIALWQQKQKEPKVDAENILNKLGGILEKYADSKEDLIFEAEVFYENNIRLARDVAEMLQNLEEEEINEELARKMRDLHIAEEKKEKEKSAEILKEINELNKKKEEIKNSRFSA